MKNFYSLLFTLLVTVAAISQTNWTGAVNTDWQNAGNWDNGVPNTNTEIAVFNTGTTLSVINVPTVTIGGLSITGNTDLTLSHTGARTLTIANGSGATDFNIESGSALTMGTNISITLATASVVASVDGTFIINSGRTYDANNAGNSTTVNGTIENSGIVSGSATTLTFADGGTSIHARNAGTVPTATWNAASTCEITGVTNTAPAGMGQAFGNFTWNCPNQGNNAETLAGSGMSIAGTLSVNNTGTAGISGGRVEMNQTSLSAGSLVITGGTLRIGSNANRTLTVSGDVSISGGALLMSTGPSTNDIGTLNVAGNFSQSGGDITESVSGNGAIVFNGTSTQTFSKTGGTISNTINYTINNNAIVDFGTSVLDGSAGTFTLSAGGKIITANAGGVPSTIQVSGTKTYSSGADYEFGGASTGTFSTSPAASTVRNMTINNTSGNVTLAQPMAVTGTLVLTDGELNTDATNIITIDDNATTSGASDNSFVNGPMAKAGDDAFTFPVGKSGAGLRTIGISAPTASSTFTAEFLRANPYTAVGSALGSGITQISGCEYWTLDRTGTGNASVILSWAAGSSCSAASYVTNTGTLKVAHWNGSSWVDEGRLSTTGNNTAGTITTAADLTSFSPFALASNSSTGNPLPVMFADVKAYQRNSGIQIEWSNLTERDLVKYAVERSANGQAFTTISEQLPRSNNNDKESYSSYDGSPLQGINFYRIKVFEIGGKIIYSKVLKVDLSGKQEGFGLYPNPVTSGVVSVSMNTKQGQYAVKVLNSAGQQVYSQRLNHQGGMITQTVDLSSVKPGIYNMVITGENYRESKMFIIQ